MDFLVDENFSVNSSKDRLKFLLSFDEWQLLVAVQIIENIDPEFSTNLDMTGNFEFGNITMLNMVTIPELDPEYKTPMHYNCEEMDCEYCLKNTDTLKQYSDNCNDTLRLLENKSKGLLLAKPAYWIEKALSKDIHIEWLESAIENGLYKPDSGYQSKINQPEEKSPYVKGTIQKGRIEIILQVAKAMEYDIHCIPHGGKTKIKNKCLEDSTFSDSTFDAAWKAASRTDLLSVNGKNTYNRRY